jgi:hypothetical protein
MGSGNVVGASARVLDVVRRLVALSQVLHSRECSPQFREHQADGLAGQGGDEQGQTPAMVLRTRVHRST